MATAHTVFVPGVGYAWELRDGVDVLVGGGGFVDAATADAAASDALGSDWPGTPADGTWHYVGDSGEPAFENSWTEGASGSVPRSAFRVREAGVVDLAVFAGRASASALAIFVLPVDYRPGGDTYIPATGVVSGTATPILLVVTTAGGAVAPSSAVDAVQFTGQLFLDPPELVP